MTLAGSFLSSEKVEALWLMLICFISQPVHYSTHVTWRQVSKNNAPSDFLFYLFFHNLLLHFIVRNDGGDPLS